MDILVLEPILFAGLAAVAAVSGLLVIVQRHAVYAALCDSLAAAFALAGTVTRRTATVGTLVRKPIRPIDEVEPEQWHAIFRANVAMNGAFALWFENQSLRLMDKWVLDLATIVTSIGRSSGALAPAGGACAGADPQVYGIGLKELWDLKPEKHQPGLVLHTAGWLAAMLRDLAGINLVGGDVVEVSPPYDTTGNTALLAANLVFEALRHRGHEA